MQTRLVVKTKPLQASAHSPQTSARPSLSRRQILTTVPIILGLESPLVALASSEDLSRSIEKDYDRCGRFRGLAWASLRDWTLLILETNCWAQDLIVLAQSRRHMLIYL